MVDVSPEQEKKWIREVAEARKTGKRYENVDELISDILE